MMRSFTRSRQRALEWESLSAQLRWGLLVSCLALLATCGDATTMRRRATSCDVGDGQWVWDFWLPRYNGLTCGAIDPEKNCQKMGRKNMNYQKYRWQPNACPNYKRMTPNLFADALRNKVVMVAGDSVSRILASSVLCILSAAKRSQFRLSRRYFNGVGLPAFRSDYYNITVLRVFSNTLNQIGSVDGSRKAKRIDIDVVDPRIRGLLSSVDVAIFQAAAWWTNFANQYYVNNQRQDMDVLSAYSRAVTTLAKYLEDKSQFKGRALLLSPSPSHYNLPDGVPAHSGECQFNKPFSPDLGASTWKQLWLRQMYDTQKQALGNFTTLRFLDISRMSASRADGHLANAGKGPGMGDDCLHWCEAGVTDAWVEIIYNRLISS